MYIHRIADIEPGIQVKFSLEYDDYADISYLEPDPEDTESDTLHKTKRLELLERGHWEMVGLIAALYVDGVEITSDSLWGIESDSGTAYFKEIEDDMLDTMKAHYKKYIHDYLNALEMKFIKAKADLGKYCNYPS